ncbi:c-type cytochrome [Spirosoma sordidisoli]|nr:c-type cytochrome [Spirosoma sordidisoli]
MTNPWWLIPVFLMHWYGWEAVSMHWFRAEAPTGASAVKTDTLPERFGPGAFGFGRPAEPAQVATLDIDVRPDGTGLPAGSGTVATGAVIFAAKCSACHGAGGTGGPNGALVITDATPGKRPAKVIGNYWPYATTVFDYIRRAMPFNEPGSLTNDEVYALTAFLLHRNKLIDEKTVMNAKTVPAVRMPAQASYVPDDRTGGPEIR